MKDDIVCLLLAAGDSSRLWPLGDKHLIPFLGQPLIYHAIRQLDKYGFKNIVIVANNDNKVNFDNLIKIYSLKNVSIVVQTNKRGMAGAVLTVKEKILRKKLLVIGPSDVFENILFSSFQNLLSFNPDGIISGITQESYFPGGYLKVSKDMITGIYEKPKSSMLPSNIVTFVFDYFKQGDLLVEAIEKVGEKSDDSFEQAIDLLVKEGKSFKLLHYKGFWGYLKYPWHILNLISYYLGNLEDKKGKGVEIDKTAVISGKVHLGDNVKVLENAKILGPTYIGCGTLIGNNAVVRESMVGENCVVGFGSEIARSYIGNNCWFHSNYIGDSIISHNVSMGAGAVIANFRLDEKVIKSNILSKMIETGKVKLGAMIGENVRIGVNSSIMPGVKIGKNSFIGAGVVLEKDLSDNKYCTLSDSHYVIKDNEREISKKDRKEQRSKLKYK